LTIVTSRNPRNVVPDAIASTCFARFSMRSLPDLAYDRSVVIYHTTVR
jgi:hypothetical protein